MKDTELKNRLKNNSESLKQSIKVPFDIKTAIEESEESIMENKKIHTHLLKKFAISAASVAAVFVLSFNCIPSLAYAVSDIPVLKDVVRVVTFGRFEVENGGYEAKVVTPKVEGLLNKDLEEQLNKEFKENSQAVIAAFEKDVKELTAQFGDDFHLGVEANYTILTDNDSILAIDCYIVNMVGSSSTVHNYYNIDKKTGTLIELEDLFKENADFVTPISEYILADMRRQNAEEGGYFWTDDEFIDNFREINREQKFYINDNGNIVICFDKYQVAAGAQGCPEFVIPDEIIEDILK